MADYDRDATNAALRKLGYSTPEDLMSSPEDSTLGGVAPATTTAAVPPDNFDLREPYENPAVEDPTGAPLGSVASTKTEEPVASPPAPEPEPAPAPVTEAGPPAPPPELESRQPEAAPAVVESTQPAPVTEAGPPPAADTTPAGPPAPGAVHPAVEAPPQEAPATPAAPAPVTITVGAQPAPKAAPAPGGGAISRLKSDIRETVSNEQEIAARQAALQDETAEGRENIGDQRNQANQAAIGQSVERESDRQAMFEKRRGEMEAELNTLKSKIANPPTDIMGIVTSLAAGIAAARGRPEIGAAFQSVGKLLNKRMQRYAGEIEAGKVGIEGLGKLINVDHLGAMDETEQQSLINKAVNAEMLSAVDTLTKSSANREDANKYRMVGEEIRKKALEQELAIRQKAQLAQAALNKKAGLKAADLAMHRAIFASDDPAIQLKVAKQFGPEGDRVLKTGLGPREEMLKQESAIAGIDAKHAEAEKNRRKVAGEGPTAAGTEVVSGLTVNPSKVGVWDNHPVAVKSKFITGQAAVPGLIKDLQELKGLVDKHGTESSFTEAGARMATIYGNLIGQIKETEELGALDKGVETLVGRMVPDPNSLTPEFAAHTSAGIDQAIQLIQSKADSKAESMGLQRPKMAGPVTLKDSATGEVLKPMDAAMAAAAQKANPGRLVPVE